MKHKQQIILYLLIFLLTLSYVSAATKYWLGNGVNLAFDSDTTLLIDTTNNRVGIGDATPEYKFDVEGTGTVAYFLTSTGAAITASATNYGIYGVNTGSNGRGVYGWSSAFSGGYGVYGRTSSSSGYSGYFTGGSGLYSDGNEVYAPTNCRYVSASADSVSCSSPEELVGGGCYCYCGSNRLRYSVPNTNMLTWQCSCADCTAYTYAICCG